jgi:hypothetical protein
MYYVLKVVLLLLIHNILSNVQYRLNYGLSMYDIYIINQEVSKRDFLLVFLAHILIFIY